MTSPTDEQQQKIEAYLGKLRGRLRSMNEHEVHEIIRELRAHIEDKTAVRGGATASTVDSTLDALGSPEALSSQYLTVAFLSQAEINRSPVRILQGLFRWASLSIAGLLVMAASIIGYVLGGALMLSALLKLIHPHSAGLWAYPISTGDLQLSLRMGFGGPPIGSRDVLGWWILPVGLLTGCGLVALTTRFALWCARRYRQSRVLP
jgi:uncharacterized membrane protein